MAQLCAAGVQLRKEIDRLWKGRDKASDGWIGDKAHAARKSDHNPDTEGYVYALDIDKDLSSADKRASWRLADQLREIAKTDGRIKYVVHMGQITSGTYRPTRWKWRRTTGDPHNFHIHVSFTPKGKTDGRPFGITK